MQTKRLYLRELTPNDALNLYRLNLNTDVIRFTGDVAFDGIEEARIYLKQYDNYAKHGVGRWAVIHQDTGEFLGWCGLRYTEETKEYDLGFRFLKQHWNKGYATEAAAFCLDMAFNSLDILEVVSHAHELNKASHNVLKKIGMNYKKTLFKNNSDWLVYSSFNPKMLG